MTRTERLLSELIALPSVNPAFAAAEGTASRPEQFGEKKVAEFLVTVAARAGLDIELQPVLPNRPNVIARLRPAGDIRRTILLAPHLDTVVAAESQFSPRRKNGRMYGRGACDTKGSVAAMLTALCELAESRTRPRETEIIFAGLIDEENGQAGSWALVEKPSSLSSLFQKKRDRQNDCPTLAIVGEPTRLQVVTAHKGSLWMQLTTRGKAAHGATPHLGKNAVLEMAKIVEFLEKDYAKQLRRRRHPLLGAATVNVGTIHGGRQPNIVPDRCTISIDRRTLPGETPGGVEREIRVLLKTQKLSATIESAKLAPAPALETNRQLPLVREFIRSVGQSRPVGVDYFCDASVLSAGGIPSVVFGPGDIAQAHTADEWISLSALELGKNQLLKFLKSLS